MGAMKGPGRQVHEFVLLRKDGGRVLVRSQAAGVRGADGAPAGVYCAFSEVHVQLDLERSVALSEALFDDASWGVVLVDADLRPAMVNAHAARSFGAGRTALLGRPLGDVVVHGVEELEAAFQHDPGGGHPARPRRGVGDAADALGGAAPVLAQRFPAARVPHDGGGGPAGRRLALPGRDRGAARGAGGGPAAVPVEPTAPGGRGGGRVRGPGGGGDGPPGVRPGRVRGPRPGGPGGGRPAPDARPGRPGGRARPVLPARGRRHPAAVRAEAPGAPGLGPGGPGPGERGPYRRGVGGGPPVARRRGALPVRGAALPGPDARRPHLPAGRLPPGLRARGRGLRGVGGDGGGVVPGAGGRARRRGRRRARRRGRAPAAY